MEEDNGGTTRAPHSDSPSVTSSTRRCPQVTTAANGVNRCAERTKCFAAPRAGRWIYNRWKSSLSSPLFQSSGWGSPQFFRVAPIAHGVSDGC